MPNLGDILLHAAFNAAFLVIGVWWGRRMAYGRVRKIIGDRIERYRGRWSRSLDWAEASSYLYRYDADQALHEEIFGEMKPPPGIAGEPSPDS